MGCNAPVSRRLHRRNRPSIHAPHVECNYTIDKYIKSCTWPSIHAPMRGCNFYSQLLYFYTFNYATSCGVQHSPFVGMFNYLCSFNPCTPCGVQQFYQDQRLSASGPFSSIHAPIQGATLLNEFPFFPLQSTHSCGVQPKLRRQIPLAQLGPSIHAPRAGRNTLYSRYRSLQSMHPCGVQLAGGQAWRHH